MIPKSSTGQCIFLCGAKGDPGSFLSHCYEGLLVFTGPSGALMPPPKVALANQIFCIALRTTQNPLGISFVDSQIGFTGSRFRHSTAPHWGHMLEITTVIVSSVVLLLSGIRPPGCLLPGLWPPGLLPLGLWPPGLLPPGLQPPSGR